MDKKLNDELAEYTDRVFRGEDMTTSEENYELAVLVHQMHEIIRPDEPPTAEFRTRLEQRLNDEFKRNTREQKITPITTSMQWPLARLVMILIVVIGVGVLLLSDQQDSGLEGTADGQLPLDGMLIVLAAAIAGAVAYYVYSRRR